jgi:hypothetical protein
MQTIERFAQKYRVKVRHDTCDEAIISGRRVKDMPDRPESCSHIFDNGDGRLGVCLLFTSARTYGNARRTLETAGFAIRQNGHSEGIALFDPADDMQARLALTVAHVRIRRKASPAQLQHLDAIRARSIQARWSPISDATGV